MADFFDRAAQHRGGQPLTMPEAAVPRPSASVILVRDAPAGLETFMVRRHARSRVAPSAFVFPGGTVRSDDALPVDFAPSLSARSDTPVPAEEARAFYVAAVRELFEEAGVLLVREEPGQLLGVDDSDVVLRERLAAARLALQATELSLAQLLRECGWQPAFDELVPFSHWVTPDLLSARFDTRFFIAHMPPRQSALHCTIETSEGIWLRPADLLDGTYPVVYATAQHLRRLLAYESIAELLEFAQHKPIKRVQPEMRDTGGGLTVWLPPHLADSW